jgi:hypothetical protein
MSETQRLRELLIEMAGLGKDEDGNEVAGDFTAAARDLAVEAFPLLTSLTTRLEQAEGALRDAYDVLRQHGIYDPDAISTEEPTKPGASGLRTRSGPAVNAEPSPPGGEEEGSPASLSPTEEPTKRGDYQSVPFKRVGTATMRHTKDKTP